MKTFKNIFLIVLVVVCGRQTMAQLIDPLEEKLNARIKQPDEFFMRFNYELDKSGQEMPSNRQIQKNRYYDLASCIDEDLLKEAENKTVVLDFLRAVTDSLAPVKLRYSDPGWYAMTDCLVNFRGKEQNLKLFLNTQAMDHGEHFSWRIFEANAPFLHPENDTIIYLSPVSHNLNFLHLGKNLKSHPESFSALLKKNGYSNDLPIVDFLFRDRQLQFIAVQKLTFQFYQVPGFAFKVENLNRADGNAGWLITEIDRVESGAIDELYDFVK